MEKNEGLEKLEGGENVEAGGKAAASEVPLQMSWVWKRRAVLQDKPLQLQRVIARGICLHLLLALVGLAVFAAMHSTAFNGRSLHFVYSSPLSAMWMGLGGLWFSTVFCLWWVVLCPSFTRAGHYYWAGCGALMAVLGLICLISHAASRNEGGAAGAALIWILGGASACAMSMLWIREDKTSRTMREPAWGCGLRCLCSGREWLVGWMVFLQVWMFAFLIGVTIQAASSAADYAAYPPIGTVYEIEAMSGVTVQMHMFCQGPRSASATMVMEHGGGANCLALKGIADELSNTHGMRTCIYDRIGYGWTPSLYVKGKDDGFPDSGTLLQKLLTAAGEAGPFVCVGHSAGAAACMRFAEAAKGEVTGIAMMDGYPDLIVGGAWRPGVKKYPGDSPAISGTQMFAVIAGPTGFTRGLVGDPGETYVPKTFRAAMTALYAQTRFWLAQYSDLVVEKESGDAAYLYPLMGGVVDERGVVSYGRTLGAHVLVMPASTTVHKECSATYQFNEYCCSRPEETWCKDSALDSSLYLAQAELYATTVGTSGALEVAPLGTAHGYPYQQEHYGWVVEQLVKHFPP